MRRLVPDTFCSAARIFSTATEPSVAAQTRPRRKLTAFVAFLATSLKRTTGLRMGEAMKACAAEWKILGDEERANYAAKAEELNAHPPQVPVRRKKKCGDQQQPRVSSLTPHNMFVKDRYDSVRDRNLFDRLKALGAAWKALAPEERQRYKEAADIENFKRRAEAAEAHTEAGKPRTKQRTSAYQLFMASSLKVGTGSMQERAEAMKASNAAWKTLGEDEKAQYIANAEEHNATQLQFPAKLLRQDRPRHIYRLSALNVFMKDQYSLVAKENHPDGFKALHVAWKALAPEERERYKEAADIANVKRRAEAIRFHRPRHIHGLSAFNMFMKEQYSSVVVEKHLDRFKALHMAWKALAPEAMQRYQEAADADNTRRWAEAANKITPLSPKPRLRPKAPQTPTGPSLRNRPPLPPPTPAPADG